VHLAAARLIGRPALTGLALAHGYDTAFRWTAGIFAPAPLAREPRLKTTCSRLAWGRYERRPMDPAHVAGAREAGGQLPR
jgi:hypothetical protein